MSTITELTRLLPEPKHIPPPAGPGSEDLEDSAVVVVSDGKLCEAGFLRRLGLTLVGLVLGAEIHGFGLLLCTLVEWGLPAWLALRPKLLVLDTMTGTPTLTVLAMQLLPVPTATRIAGMPRVRQQRRSNGDVFGDLFAPAEDDWRPSIFWIVRFSFMCGVTLTLLGAVWIVGCHLGVVVLKWVVCGRQRAGQFSVWRSERGYLLAAYSVAIAASLPGKTWMTFDAWVPSCVWVYFFRFLGAKVGKDVTFAGGPPLLDFHGVDLLRIGDRVVFDEKSRVALLLLCTPNLVKISKVQIGDDVLVAAVAEIRAGADIGAESVICAGAGCDSYVPPRSYVTSNGVWTDKKRRRPPGAVDSVLRRPNTSLINDWVPALTLIIAMPVFLCMSLSPVISLIFKLTKKGSRLRTLAECAGSVACREIAQASERLVSRHGVVRVEAWQVVLLRMFRDQHRGALARQAGAIFVAVAWAHLAAPAAIVLCAVIVKRCLHGPCLLGGESKKQFELTPDFVCKFKTVQAWCGLAVDASAKLFLYTGLMNLVYASLGLSIEKNATISELLVSRGSLECVDVGRGAYLAANLCFLTSRVSEDVVTFEKTTIARGSFVGPLTVAAPGTSINGATGSCAVVDGTIERSTIAVGDDGVGRLGWRPRPRDAWLNYPEVYAVVSTLAIGGFSLVIEILSLMPHFVIFYFLAPHLAFHLLWNKTDLLPRIVHLLGRGIFDYSDDDDDDDTKVSEDGGLVLNAHLTLAYVLIHNGFFVLLNMAVTLLSGPMNASIHVVTKWLLLGRVVPGVEYDLRSQKHLAWMLTLKAGRLGSIPASFCYLVEYVRVVVTSLGTKIGTEFFLFPHPETIQAFPEADVISFGDDVLFSAHIYGHDFSAMHLTFRETTIQSHCRAPNAWQAQVLPGTSLPPHTTLDTVGRASFFPGVANESHRTYRGNPARVVVKKGS